MMYYEVKFYNINLSWYQNKKRIHCAQINYFYLKQNYTILNILVLMPRKCSNASGICIIFYFLYLLINQYFLYSIYKYQDKKDTLTPIQQNLLLQAEASFKEEEFLRCCRLCQEGLKMLPRSNIFLRVKQKAYSSLLSPLGRISACLGRYQNMYN